MADRPRLAVESIAGQRPYQEDAVIAEPLPDGRMLIAVADGMGGHAAGEIASALALETLTDALGAGRGLGDAFRMANERVHRMAAEPGKQGMGTTLAAVLVDGAEYRVANVGDSRVYLISAGGIRRLTEDHSFVAEAMRRGQSESEAMATPWRDALTRSIGTEDEVEVDVFGPFALQDDSALLICSDGLYKTIPDDELRDIFIRSGGARGAAQSLVTAAYDAGSDDNISVVIAEYGEVPREAAATTMVFSYDVTGADELEAADPERPTDPSLPALPAAAPASVAAPAGAETADAGAVAPTSHVPLAAVAAAVLVIVTLLAVLVLAG